MEEKKEPGMIWYSYLRFFVFGLFRIWSFNGIMAALATLNESITTLAIISLIFAISDFALRIVVHRHLENYSTTVFKSLLLYYVFRIVLWTFKLLPTYGLLAPIFISTLLNGLMCLINYKYFRNRSNIFVNECDFFGGVKNVSTLKQNNIISSDLNETSAKTYQLIYDDETISYAKYLAENSYGLLVEEDAYKFIRILQIYIKFGKESAMEEFDVLVKEMIDKERDIVRASFFVGALCANEIISDKEKEELNKKYLDRFKNNSALKKDIKNNFCRKCGAKLAEDSKFCHKCGTGVINFEDVKK